MANGKGKEVTAIALRDHNGGGNGSHYTDLEREGELRSRHREKSLLHYQEKVNIPPDSKV